MNENEKIEIKRKRFSKIEKRFLVDFFVYGKDCGPSFCIRKWDYSCTKYFSFSEDTYSYQYYAKNAILRLQDAGIVHESLCLSDVRKKLILHFCIYKKDLKVIYEILKNDDFFNTILFSKINNYKGLKEKYNEILKEIEWRE